MITERLQKSREFIEGQCVKAASAQNRCRELKNRQNSEIVSQGRGRQIGNLPNSSPLY